MWTYFSISASAWGQARSKIGGVDTSILHHAFISIIFIALWAIITHYISILMAILSYFTRFTMKRGNAGSWNSGWKRSKHWKPILHCSKNPETPRKSFLELIRIIGQRKYRRGPTPWPGGWGARPYLLGPLVALRCPSSTIWRLLPWKKSWASLRDETPPPRGGTLRNQSRALAELFCRGHFPPGGGNNHQRHHQRSSHQEGVNLHQHLHQHHLLSNPSSSLVSNLCPKSSDWYLWVASSVDYSL